MTGELIFFTLSAFGLGALLIASHTLFMFVKWAGAAYLVYLGLKMIIRSFRQTNAGPEPFQPLPQVKFYRQGLFMQLANPKAILFFTALLPQFINPGFSATVQFVVLGLLSITIQGSTLTAYGWLAEKGTRWLKQSRFSQWLDLLADVFMTGAGVKLALTQRTVGLVKI
jgi:homoserine/homoserine lactone efflux protein